MPRAIPSADVHDVTAHVRDGRLRWDAPPGDWRILRFGASLTGQTNGPALPDSTGLEVDKLDGRRVAAYLDRHLARFRSAEPPRFAALLSDSIESGPQNWTDAIAERFRARRGYDPTPWLPALAGFRRRRRRGIRSLPLRLPAHARRALRRRSTTARSPPKRTGEA